MYFSQTKWSNVKTKVAHFINHFSPHQSLPKTSRQKKKEHTWKGPMDQNECISLYKYSLLRRSIDLHLKRPSGSKGARHHEGEVSGNWPLEEILHSFKPHSSLALIKMHNNGEHYKMKKNDSLIPLDFCRQV